MSLEVAMWASAIGTVVLAVFAVVTAWYARKGFRKQAEEVRDGQELIRHQTRLLQVHSGQLELQQRQFERDQAERRRSQASQVYMWQTLVSVPVDGEKTPGTTAAAHVRNASRQPIYDLRIEWWIPYADYKEWKWRYGPPHFEETPLMPQATASALLAPGLAADPDEVDASAAFRDRAGVWWRIRPTGRLQDLTGAPGTGLPAC